MSDVRVLSVLPLIELFSQALAACHYTHYKTRFHWKTNTWNTICCLSRTSFRFIQSSTGFRARHVKISCPLPRYYLLLWHLFKASLSNKPKIPGELLMRMVHLIKNEQVTTPRSLPLLLFNKSASCVPNFSPLKWFWGAESRIWQNYCRHLWPRWRCLEHIYIQLSRTGVQSGFSPPILKV